MAKSAEKEKADNKEIEEERGLAPQAGGTAGGASESQQHQESQESPERPLPGSTEAEIPDYDPETARGVTPLTMNRSTSEQYDDDAAGKPGDADDDSGDADDDKKS